ncbi:MAG TPA: hypothetical protein VIV40_26030 [Kofleriaceae bacterium]
MRRPVVLVILAAASGALATPAAQPSSWADWVGDWDGKLKSTSCSLEVGERASFALDAIDGAVTVDLSPASSSLPQLSLVEDGDGWMGQQGDVTVRVKRIKPDKIGDRLELAVDLDSGCQVRGTLTRGSVGIAACDRLAAWARIESHCTKLSRPPLENAARLARQRAEWRKARGDDRSKLAAQCSARSTKVEQQLIDTGCAPNADPAIGMRGAECQALRGIAGRLGRCGNLPSDQRDAYAREVLVLLAAAQGADKASLPVVDGECKRERDKLFAIAQQVGCPP